MNVRRAVELTVRTSYGRLVAYLSARTRDVAAAEDALGDALLAALDTWPETGIPDRPEAWLLTAARRRLLDRIRRAQTATRAAPLLLQATEELLERVEPFPDERLPLLFVCAHPAIDLTIRTPLMLQTVLGLDAATIASAFLVAPTAMGQRLVRAKARIKDAGLAFALPEPEELPERLDAVLEAIYAAYGSGWESVSGGDPRRRGLTEEAIWLGRLVVGLLPEAPEARGLLALMLHCEARREARRDAGGRYVPLAEQDVARWSRPLIAEAESLLAAAARARRPGRFQLEAAIQSAHARRAFGAPSPWEDVALLYEGLVRLAPTVGALIGRAAALAEARGAAAGLALLAEIPLEAVRGYQPYWALSAHLLTRLGRTEEARQACTRAVGLSEDPTVRAFLLARYSDRDQSAP
jgi:RNA polymerase sigma-70 factor (ECF subfamily)